MDTAGIGETEEVAAEEVVVVLMEIEVVEIPSKEEVEMARDSIQREERHVFSETINIEFSFIIYTRDSDLVYTEPLL